jgi:transcriptional regulator with XRE-family HTH domain
MTNKEKFLALTEKHDGATIERIKWRLANRSWIKRSQAIAIKILLKLEELGLSQKDLAAKMKVTPQYINKIVKGHENLTLDLLDKLEEALGIDLLVKAELLPQQIYTSRTSYNAMVKFKFNSADKTYTYEYEKIRA